MDFLHTRIKIIRRNAGRSAVAAAAYRSGTQLVNSWDGVTHDYTRKGYVVHSEIMLPENAPDEYMDRSTLWNSVEWAETDRNAQLAREIDIGLPNELTHDQHIGLVRKYVQENFVSKGMCADFSIHDKKTGNPHVHILLTMRPLNEDGTWGQKSRLVYDLDENGNRIHGNQKGRWKTHKETFCDWDDRGNGKKWRVAAADAINEAMKAAGYEDMLVDPRTYAEQGINRIPTIHEGPTVRAMERKGIRTTVGDQNREIREWNKQADQIEARLAKMTAWARYEAKREQVIQENGLTAVDHGFQSRLFLSVLNDSNSKKKSVTRLKDATGMMSIMDEYDIHDAASFLEASKKINTKFYRLRHDLIETEQIMGFAEELLKAVEQRKKYKGLYAQYVKTPDKKKEAFYEANRAELTLYEAAIRKIQDYESDGKVLKEKDLKEVLKYLSQKQFVLSFDLKRMKDKTHHMEIVKHAFIDDKKKREVTRNELIV